MSSPRLLLATLALTAATVVGLLGVRWAGSEGADGRCPDVASRAVPARLAASPGAGVGEALAVLHAWDVRRAAAWAAGDAAALGRLYAPGSAAGRHDVAMLRSWAARGMRVHGMRMQVLDLRVRRQARDRLVVVVTDRLARAVAVGRGLRLALPRDTASTRRVALRRPGPGREWRVWRVVAVRPQASPAASTSATSRSWKR